jgi:GNAT superfamily N-acetyltransferase
MKFIEIINNNIEKEHICCAFSDKKYADGYNKKKQWLKKEFANGYKFVRLDERAKVFIEYGPSEKAWIPITAKNYLNINCFWVSGKYKNHGYGKKLLEHAILDAKKDSKDGLVTVVGTKKFHFMSDTKWLLKQGFEIVETTDDGFALLVLKLKKDSITPIFNPSVKDRTSIKKEGIVVYYSNRCPYSEYHVQNSLIETVKKRDISYEIIKLNTYEEAQNSPTLATVFSLFYNGKFITTDLSICMDSRFEKIIKINNISIY